MLIKSGDIIIAVIILVLTAFLLMLPSSGRENFVVIYLDGDEYARYNLSQTTKSIVEVESKYGQNTVAIENGNVYVTKSSCKDKLEISAGQINKKGQTLVCLPNRVVVTIEGGKQIDATTF